MEPEEIRRIWQSGDHGPAETANAALLKVLLSEEHSFKRSVLWKDIREMATMPFVAIAYVIFSRTVVVHAGGWALPFAAALLLWPGWFVLVDRIIQKKQEARFGATLRDAVERSLARVNHRIVLLQNVLWWLLLPVAAALAIFTGRLMLFVPEFWPENLPYYLAVLAFCILSYFAISWINRQDMKRDLLPRKAKLEAILAGLEGDGEYGPD